MCTGSLGTSASACFLVKETTAFCSSPKSFQGSYPLLYPDMRSFWNRHLVLLSLQGETQDSFQQEGEISGTTGGRTPNVETLGKMTK